MKLFLKYNSSFADFYSLYQSALQGEYAAVEMILGYIDDMCQPCVPEIYTELLEYNLTSETGQIKFHGLHQYEKWFVNLDNVFNCESALNAAVRNGYVDIMKLLISKSIYTVNCPSFDGSIPLMTAVKYNQTELFKILFVVGTNKLHRCRNMKDVDLFYLIKKNNFHLRIKNFKQFCPTFGGVEHLLALYDNLDIIQFAREKGNYSWYSRDIDGVTPIHYAFCHNSIKFLKYIVLGKRLSYLRANLRSNNGSSPFHSAAICKSTALFYFFNPNKNNKYNIIPDVMDNENRSILHYAFLQPLNSEDLVKIDYLGHDAFTSSM
ncbi:uncharacterized protein LOC127709026 isoform X3 [Mytilus californianus]|uniref:uncharacterized protein LOC127709026 isoform X3 n=1 Tax=Mytilus californianus TaxID=6549 RepID=UPI00224585DE|nr:uncharacterized protein LOC127709026 isoform X3 [Mytilus californianus]